MLQFDCSCTLYLLQQQALDQDAPAQGILIFKQIFVTTETSAQGKQENPAIADKPARRESLPKIAPIRRAYNVVADNTGLSSFV